jgi:serine/threonine-protein kinase
MEYIEGPSLTLLVEQLSGATMPMARAADIVRQTADALGAAHDMGIVHRDLKPDNIMVARTREGADWVKVVDFGIAKAAGAGAEAQKVTKTGHVIGTPDYMSPEQLAGDRLDGRSDIYALGLVAYNLLTGKLPFPSDSQQESMIMRLTEKPQPLAEARPDITWSADLQAVMDKVLERDVDARYRTAPEFGRELARAVAKLPAGQAARQKTPSAAIPAPVISAPSPVPPTRVVVAQKKKTPMFIGIGAAVVVIGGGLMAMKQMSGTKQPPAQSTVPATDTQTTTQAAVPDSTVTQRLTALIDLSNDPARGQQVLNAVSSLAPQAKSSEELFLVTRLRASVAAAAGDTVQACGMLKAVRDSLAQAEKDKVNDRMKNVLSCPR